ncbi:glycosyltransferase [Pedobacter petrophilus]|uniref:Glycosyltransferase n=1 Tax=Pedobacter petrophilus TaxID=1908241 RepID=A0A7K0FZ81_9SPHI|nr:galactosyltransferase-related protein [Pedobacter petrophilus]MRX76510.1 glycosyltransferase [Pedobacter petrophilus]
MISVLTIVAGRKTALSNLIKGLAESTVLPDELVIVFMNEPTSEMPLLPFPVHCYSLMQPAHLPLAAARNLAARNANGDFLIFLDVDCIPSATLIADYKNQISAHALLSGQVSYLKSGATNADDFLSRMEGLSTPDPIRAGLETISYSLFWSLNFACSKTTYQKIGGFDEGYKGYGAEDTDFSFSAEQQQVPLQCVPAKAYHQYHDSFSPPLNHLEDIIGNANRFFQKWNSWPMEGWLKAFQQMGLIKWDGQDLRLIRMPTEEEIMATLKK